MKKYLNILISIIFGAGFLILAFYKVSFKDVVESFYNFNAWYVFPIILSLVLYFLVRGYRWGLTFKPQPVPPYKSLFSTIMIGVLINNFIPAKIGEVSRAFIIGKKEKISISLTFGTIIVERVFDLLALFFCFFVLFVFSVKEQNMLAAMPSSAKAALLLAFVMFLVTIIILILFKMKTEYFIKVVEGIIKIFSKNLALKIDNWFNSVVEGSKCLNDPKNSLKIFVTSVMQWLLSGLGTWFTLLSFNVHISVISACYIMIFITIVVSVSPAPGGIGLTQWIATVVLPFYAVNYADALAFSIVLNFLSFGVGTIIGLYFFFKERINYTELFKFSEEKR